MKSKTFLLAAVLTIFSASLALAHSPHDFANSRDAQLSCTAAATHQASECDGISVPDQRTLCAAMITGRPASCDAVKEHNLQFFCYAMTEKFSTPCEALDDGVTVAYCYAQSVHRSARFCKGLKTTDEVALCNALAADQASGCDVIVDASRKNYCIGLVNEDARACSAIR